MTGAKSLDAELMLNPLTAFVRFKNQKGDK